MPQSYEQAVTKSKIVGRKGTSDFEYIEVNISI